MKQKLNMVQIISMSLMLFALFFGAGNMIFPPALGQAAGSNMLPALAGFIFTDAGLSLLGIIAIVLAGSSLSDLSNKVGPRFAVGFAMLVYFLIGPLFAIPRTGSVSFSMSIVPLLPAGTNPLWVSIAFTALFFGITFLLSLNPNRLVDIVGKILTPVLLLAIGAIWIAALLHPIGPVGVPTGDYATIPFFKGFIEGYLALDGLAALVFALLVIDSIKSYGVTDKKSIIKYAIIAGALASAALAAVYWILAYIGATSGALGQFSNGSELLAAVAYYLFGGWGNLVLGVAVIFACLTTSIGLTSSFGDYFHKTYPKLSYRAITSLVCLFSFGIANFGLNNLIAITLPVLIMVYPVTVVLIVASFFDRWFKSRSEVYIGGMLMAFCVSFISGLETGGLSLGVISQWTSLIPFYQLGIGWLIPAVIGCVIGYGVSILRLSSKK